MLHHAWLPEVIASSSVGLYQPEAPSAGAAPPPPASTPVNVVGLPSGSQPAAGGATTPATTGQQSLPPPGAPRPQGPDMTFIWVMVGGMLVLMMVMNIWTGRGEKKRRAALMASISKGDRVVMTGGVIGTIAELADTEVVIRVEEGKIRYAKAAIQQVLESREKTGEA